MTPEFINVPVRGGALRVARWTPGPDAPVVIAAHGITANHKNFSLLGDLIGDEITLIAPDLRGRGRSGKLPGPFGMRAHTEDLIATLDHFGVERATFLGHSMGGFVIPVAATLYPDRVTNLVVVDGGVEIIEVDAGTDIEELAKTILGPSMERLAMTFPTRRAYLDFWEPHPGLKACVPELVEDYFTYDLVGEEGAYRSSVSREAVLADCTSELTEPTVVGAIERVTQPMTFLWAARGVFDQTPGLYSEGKMAALRERVPQLESAMVDANHWTLLFGAGVHVVAEHVRKVART
ncbi:MAG: alpha/beta fold hydrolase [Actinomycetota bacterium]|nr:alpha/beta fold hydrolase [Actinomycetota bacterium]